MAANTPTTPPEVEIVRSFVNTIDVDEGTEQLSSPEALERWLRDAGLLAKGARASGRDLKLALRLRAALRDELIDHHDGVVDPKVKAALEDVCCALPLKAVCDPDGLAPSEGGVRGALAQVMAAATTSRIKGTWPRLKLCPAEDCLWAFYDVSRNRSKRWCSMEVCGNRSKVRAYRDRAHT
jgi:predicted RNA-binding Zn ribbon-like protein